MRIGSDGKCRVALLLGAGAAALVGACATSSQPPCTKSGVSSSGVPYCPLTAAQVLALPDAQIYYPGSQVLRRHGSDGSRSVNGEPEDAYGITVLNASATASAIASWYQTTLAAAGWKQHEGNPVDSVRGFYAFDVSPPSSVYAEFLYLDFRTTEPAVSGTNFQLTLGVISP